MAKNDIPLKQNTQKELERLAAQRELYSSAKRFYSAQTIVSVIIPVVAAVVAIYFEKLLPATALYGLIAFIIDLLFLEPQVQARKSKAAKIQELFDCSVFKLNRSPLKVVDDISVETVLQNYEAHAKIKTNIEKIKNWYPKVVAEVDLPVARIICQRSSCWWDKDLRNRYRKILIAITAAIPIAILIICCLKHLETIQFVLICSALVPFFQFAIKQLNDNRAMDCRLEILTNYINNVWEKIIHRTVNDEMLEIESRRIQDAIYDNRTLSPLVFDFFYWRARQKNEMTMTKAAEILVEEVKSSAV
jgi:Flp pilus assembly protein TadB